ncbi:MAG TPA: signal peptide peptidase SppA [Candidatus Glassbacteria bacterium]|nr:signal peptide peptidase SppA [Candidatus Glassbacteria bacterium]
MTKNQKWLLGIVLAFLVLAAGTAFLALFIASFGGKDFEFGGSFGERVGIVEVVGIIEDSREVLQQLRAMGEDKSVKAVVLRVDSPGGAVAPSQEIYDGVRRLRLEDKKPVVVSMGSVAASGGYFVSCAADSVLASPGTLTGSIGVILEFPDLQEVLRKVGIGFEVIKSGPHKDIGSPFRQLSDRERELLQSMVDDVYGQFIEAICESRALERDSLLAIADGRVFSGRQAQDYGLVDRTGGLREAIDVAGRMSGLGENPKTVRARKKRLSVWDLLEETTARVKNPAAGLSSPRLLYLWR